MKKAAFKDKSGYDLKFSRTTFKSLRYLLVSLKEVDFRKLSRNLERILTYLRDLSVANGNFNVGFWQFLMLYLFLSLYEACGLRHWTKRL